MVKLNDHLERAVVQKFELCIFQSICCPNNDVTILLVSCNFFIDFLIWQLLFSVGTLPVLIDKWIIRITEDIYTKALVCCIRKTCYISFVSKCKACDAKINRKGSLLNQWGNRVASTRKYISVDLNARKQRSFQHINDNWVQNIFAWCRLCPLIRLVKSTWHWRKKVCQ